MNGRQENLAKRMPKESGSFVAQEQSTRHERERANLGPDLQPADPLRRRVKQNTKLLKKQLLNAEEKVNVF